MVDENVRFEPSDKAVANDPPAGTPEEQRLIQSEEIFAGRRMVVIEHAGQQYRLMITRNDRLILQK